MSKFDRAPAVSDSESPPPQVAVCNTHSDRVSSAGNTLSFALVWAFLMAGLVATQLFIANQGMNERTIAVVALFFFGSFCGAVIARLFARLVSHFRQMPSARFAAMLVGLSCGTAGMTAFLHFLHFRSFYAEWHSKIWSVHWMVEQIITGVNSTYIFIVEGMTLLLPWGLALLLAAAYDYAATPVLNVRSKNNHIA